MDRNTLILAYTAISLVACVVASYLMLRGQVRASNATHVGIALQAGLVSVAWPLTICWLLCFWVAKRLWLLRA